MAEPRYPGFVATQWYAVDGYGLERLSRGDRWIWVAAGPDAPLIDLLVAIAYKPWDTADTVDETGWYFAEREGEQWHFSLEGTRGTFSIAHASLLRVCAVILDLQAGRQPQFGETLDADEWDRRYGWARESGLLTSRIEELDKLARRYVVLLKEEGIVPGRAASAALQAARAEIVEALCKEGIAACEQPDAIFYQLKERNANHLTEVVDALDMAFGLSQRCGEVLPEPGTEAWRRELFRERPARPGTHRLALDWWMLDPDYPHDGTMGTLNFAHYCHQVFERANIVDLEPFPMEVFGKRLYLLPGRHQGKLELRSVISEQAFVDCWVQQVQDRCIEQKYVLAPPASSTLVQEKKHMLPLPLMLRVFLERIGNGGTFDYVRWLSLEEIIANNDPAAWRRSCPGEIRDAHEAVDWDKEEFPDGLVCVSGYYYNASRAYLLPDGRVVWATPTETGHRFDPPHLWLWDPL